MSDVAGIPSAEDGVGIPSGRLPSSFRSESQTGVSEPRAKSNTPSSRGPFCIVDVCRFSRHPRHYLVCQDLRLILCVFYSNGGWINSFESWFRFFCFTLLFSFSSVQESVSECSYLVGSGAWRKGLDVVLDKVSSRCWIIR